MASPVPREHRPRLRRVWIAYWIGLFAATHWPKPPHLPGPADVSDKVVHFCLYFGLAMLGCVAARGASSGCRCRAGWGWTLRWTGVYAGYAGVDEWLQPFFGRTADPWDWVCDVAGVVCAMIAARGMLARRGPA
ncbi:MAG: VanZ family protein [Phycisphaerae bacterium]